MTDEKVEIELEVPKPAVILFIRSDEERDKLFEELTKKKKSFAYTNATDGNKNSVTMIVIAQ